MQVRLTLVDLAGDRRPRDLAVEAAPGATAQDLRPLVQEVSGGADRPLYCNGALLPLDAAIGRPPLVDGAVLTLGDAGMVPPRRVPGLLELHVVGGPDSGQVLRLPPGARRLGRAAETAIRLEDVDVSRVHAEVDVRDAGVHVRDLGSSNGTYVDGDRVDGTPVLLRPGAQLVTGTSTLVLRLPEASPAAVSATGDGTLAVNRSPRIRSPAPAAEIRLPEPPARREALRLPVLASLLPLVLALVLAEVTHNATMLLFGLMSPVMLLGGYVSDRRAGRSSSAAAHTAYRHATEQAHARLDAALTLDARRRRVDLPDRAELLLTAERPTARLWERRLGDEDLLSVRVGTGTLPSSVALLDGSGARTSPEVPDVPVPLRLPDLGVVGICGPREQVVSLTRGLLADVCGWHSPVDVSLVVLVAAAATAGSAGTAGAANTVARDGGGGSEDDWGWTALLPHTRPAEPARCDNLVALAAPDDTQLLRRVAELTRVVHDRRRSAVAGISRGGWNGPRTVVLLDGAQRLRSLPGVARLLTDGPDVGVHLLCLDADPARLPVEARCTVQLGSPDAARATLLVQGSAAVTVVPDRVSARWAERFARALAPLRDATPAAGDAGLPGSARLVEVVSSPSLPTRSAGPAGPATSGSQADAAAGDSSLAFDRDRDRDTLRDPTDPACLVRQWQRRPRSTRAVLGLEVDGRYVVDLARDGPHVLVGGTTGSGKSELLQTLIASLAMVNRPDELSFVLVDYKGGAAFAQAATLPHTVGLVTDLDPHLTSRALTSLTAELRRRERLLRAASAKDLDDYQALAPPGSPVIPRLVLVIDEFRMLAEELPEFVDGMVRIAALGRSLGMHLVLATQRPAGIVSADIKANVNLRIALRVRDRADSEDVVDAPDAAAISESTPGRAVARSGSSALTAFQAARVGGPRARPLAVARVTWRPLVWERLGDPPPRSPSDGSGSGSGGNDYGGAADTDLSALAEACRQAAAVLAVPAPTSPWLAPLPDVVAIASLGLAALRPEQLPLGRLDLPAEQAQPVLSFDLERDSHLGIAGTARTGRSTLLRTLAATAASRLAPWDVHVHAMDGGSGAMAALSDLPHTGAVVPRSDPARLERLIRRLAEEVEHRRSRLAASGHTSLAEQRSAVRERGEPPLPYLLLLVDGWEGIVEALETVDHGRPVDTLLRLLRDGVGVGLRAVIAGDRGILMSKVASVVPDLLLLRMADATDLVLTGISARQVPSHLPPGRALRGRDGVEVQLGVLTDDLAGPAQAAALRQAATAARLRWAASGTGPRAFTLRPLPALVRAADVAENSGQVGAQGGAQGGAEVGAEDVAAAGELYRPGWALVGVGGDDLTPAGIDLSAPGSAALIAGPAGSGRSALLTTMACWLGAHGTPVAVVGSRRSPVQRLAGSPGVVGVLGPQESGLLADWVERHPGLVILVDDADLMLDTPVEQELLELIRRSPEPVGARAPGAAGAAAPAVVCSGSSAELAGMYRGLTVEVRKQQTGVLLWPTGFADGDLFGLRLGRLLAEERVPGRGLLVRRGTTLPVQVALTDRP